MVTREEEVRQVMDCQLRDHLRSMLDRQQCFLEVVSCRRWDLYRGRVVPEAACRYPRCSVVRPETESLRHRHRIILLRLGQVYRGQGFPRRYTRHHGCTRAQPITGRNSDGHRHPNTRTDYTIAETPETLGHRLVRHLKVLTRHQNFNDMAHRNSMGSSVAFHCQLLNNRRENSRLGCREMLYHDPKASPALLGICLADRRWKWAGSHPHLSTLYGEMKNTTQNGLR